MKRKHAHMQNEPKKSQTYGKILKTKCEGLLLPGILTITYTKHVHTINISAEKNH